MMSDKREWSLHYGYEQESPGCYIQQKGDPLILLCEDQNKLTESDYKLLVAAPDLLEALSEMYETSTHGIPAGKSSMDKAFHAICKALGRQS